MDLTPIAIRNHLLGVIAARGKDVDKMHRYYDGEHPAPTVPDTSNEAYKRLVRLATTNISALVVDAVNERLEPIGVTLALPAPVAEEDAVEPTDADGVDVWAEVWEPSDLDINAGLVHLEALTAKRSFVMVWPTDEGVSITPELSTECAVLYPPGRTRGKPVAALKVFADGAKCFVTLFTAEKVYYWTTATSAANVIPDLSSTEACNAAEWSPWYDMAPDDIDVDGIIAGEYPEDAWLEDDSLAVPNPLGAVALVEFQGHPTLGGEPKGELTTGVLRLQDRLNKEVLDMLVTAEYAAFPQRYALGLDPQDGDGKPRKLTSGPERTWMFGDHPDDIELGQLAAADLTNHLKMIEATIQSIAAVTKTPVYYLASSFANVGADTIAAVDAGLVKKCKAHQRAFGDSWATVIRLALKALGREGADDATISIVWADPEVRTRAELGDWAIKVKDIIPIEDVWRSLGASPSDIERMRAAIAATAPNVAALIRAVQQVYLGVGTVLTEAEARTMLNALGAGLDPEAGPSATEEAAPPAPPPVV